MFTNIESEELHNKLFKSIKHIYVNEMLKYDIITLPEIYAGDVKIGEIELEEYYTLDDNDCMILVSSTRTKFIEPKIIRYADDSLDTNIEIFRNEVPDDGKSWLLVFNLITVFKEYSTMGQEPEQDVSTELCVFYG